MELIYVADTVDDLIYGKEDWSEITGPEANHYWKWPLEPDGAPEDIEAPPRTPRPTEDQEWKRLGRKVPESPVEWLGVIPDAEYSVDARGTVTNSTGAVMTNPQGAATAVESVRDRPGGRFRVTRKQRLILVSDPKVHRYFVAGRLGEPFRSLESADAVEFDVSDLQPGSAYPGPADDVNGSFRIRSRGGGTIERRLDRGTWEAAIDEGQPILGRRATPCTSPRLAWRRGGRYRLQCEQQMGRLVLR